jgi:hypothetical protein
VVYGDVRTRCGSGRDETGDHVAYPVGRLVGLAVVARFEGADVAGRRLVPVSATIRDGVVASAVDALRVAVAVVTPANGDVHAGLGEPDARRDTAGVGCGA